MSIYHNLGWALFGSYLTGMYYVLALCEPFSKYLPGGIGKYYKVVNNTGVTFDDIVGCDEIKEELRNHITIMNEDYESDCSLTKGYVFVGEHGTGKTMMAKAVASESNFTFIEIYANDRDIVPAIPLVFDNVIKKYSPCVIFIDECERIINQFDDYFLRKIDGTDSFKDVILILATNNKNNLPKGIYRSGRLDKVVTFEKPTGKDRKTHLKLNFEMLKDKEIKQLTTETYGMSHADLSVVKREFDISLQIHDIPIESHYGKIKNIIQRIQNGYETKDLKLSKNVKKRVCYHEIGHMFMSYILQDARKSNTITIIPNGKYIGKVIFNTNDTTIMDYKDCMNDICILLASSVFEEYYLGAYADSCLDDFNKISNYFQHMKSNRMLKYENKNYSFFDNDFDNLNYSKIVNGIIENIKYIIIKCIKEHDIVIMHFYKELYKHEVLKEEEIDTLLGENIENLLILDVDF